MNAADTGVVVHRLLGWGKRTHYFPWQNVVSAMSQYFILSFLLSSLCIYCCRTSKIFFRDAVQVIKKYAFLYTNSPLILSLEIHCSLEQQELLASIMIEVFGDYLKIDQTRLGFENLPSPRDLEGKILLKTKFSCADNMASESDEERESVVSSESLSPAVGRSSILSWMTSPTSPTSITSPLIVANSPAPGLASPSESSFGRKSTNGRKGKRLVSKSLSNLVLYFRGKPSKDIDLPLAEELKVNQLFSLNDRKATNLMTKSLAEFKQLTRYRLMRVYPSAIRVNSSNFDPIPHWCAGTQMVALNFQTQDRALDINRALFDCSDGYGYVPRPTLSIFGADGEERTEPRFVLTILVISAQQIHIEDSDQIKAEITVEIIGRDVDCKRVKTVAVKSNGINSVWKQPFSFSVHYPLLAFLRLEILALDTSSIGGSSVTKTFTSTLESLEQGYKHIPLRSSSSSNHLSTLFVKLETTGELT